MESTPIVRSRFAILVTRGIRPDTTYASAQTREAAELLRKDAIKMGYRDARIVSSKEFAEKRRSTSRSEADQGSVDR